MSAAEWPAAQSPPMAAPMLVPATQSTRDALRLQHLEHAYVGEAAGAAPGEDEPDARALRAAALRARRGPGRRASVVATVTAAGRWLHRPSSHPPPRGRLTRAAHPRQRDAHAEQRGERVDVAVIGGGIAGMSAAYALGKLGASCRLLEAGARGWAA